MSTRLWLGALAVCLLNCAPLASKSGGTSPSASTCGPCSTDFDCFPQSEVCAITSGEGACVRPCTRNADCVTTEVCTALMTVEGNAISGCVPASGDCQPAQDAGPSPDGGPGDQGTLDAGPDGGSSGFCGGAAMPDFAATCCSCPAGRSCAANSCDDGYYCDVTSCTCVPPPAGCPGSESEDAGPGTDAGSFADAGEPDAGQPSADAGEPDAGQPSADAGEPDAGQPSADAGEDAGEAGYCDGAAGPDVADTCCTCPHGHTCTADNCYNGYYCDVSSCRCIAPPAGCPGSDAGG